MTDAGSVHEVSMAEDDAKGEGNTPEEEARKGKKRRLMIFVLLGVLITAGGGGGAAYFLMGSGEPSEPAAAAGHDEPDAKESGEDAPKEGPAEGGADGKSQAKGEGEGEAPAEGDTEEDEKSRLARTFGQTIVLKPFRMNLGNPLENHYIGIEIALQFKGGDNQKQEIERRMPQLRDGMIDVIGRKSREFLLSPDGKDQLRRELLIRVNRYMSRPIEAVYINDLLIE